MKEVLGRDAARFDYVTMDQSLRLATVCDFISE